MRSIDAVKKAVGHAAAEYIESGMVVGLGTGTTAFYFIERLIERCNEGLKIRAIASSEKSTQQAKKGGIPLIDANSVSHIDITVDGADKIDHKKRMIKGGGGALVREKIIASMSRELIVIVDETKVIPELGSCKLPVEVIPFAHTFTAQQLKKLGYAGDFRKKSSGEFFMTDNGNYIYDVDFPRPIAHPEKVHEAMIHLPGVVETGFFFNLAGRVIIGFFDGQIVVRS